ncbi:FxSxx-COOH system tetratricopeptide repeat protein [Streptomyces albidoflavus]
MWSLRSPVPASAGTGAVAAGGERTWVRAAAGLSSYHPPQPNAPVRGRHAELATLEPLARGREGSLAVVCGAGGLGKTTLAAEAAHRARQGGRAVFWVRWQDDPGRLADDFTRIAQSLGLPEASVTDAYNGRGVLVDTVWDHLAKTPGWVIVVDNVDTPRRVGPGADPVSAYRGWLRPGGAGLLLITSRDTTPDTWGPGARLLPLEPLSDTAAGAVLRHHAPAAGTQQGAEALGARLGGLPLALDAVGRYLAQPTSRHRTFTSYQTALEAEFENLLGATHPEATNPEVARTVIRHTWDLSLSQLETDGYPLARPLLHLLALLEPAPIPISLISSDLLTDATGTPTTNAEVDSALAGLHRYGLLHAGPPADTDPASIGITQVSLHLLVRDVMALTPPSTDSSTSLNALDMHLLRAVSNAAQASRACRTTACLLALHVPPVLHRSSTNDFTSTRRTLNNLVHILSETGAHAQQRHLSEHILHADTRIFGPDHPNTLTSRGRLANALSSLGRYQEAADLHRAVLADRERVLGPDHPNTLTSRNNLALALDRLGRYQEAADLFRAVLAERERVLGPDHPYTFDSRNNLANALHNLGRYQEAADLHRAVLADSERVFGLRHPDTLDSRNNLANAFYRLGRYQEAADLFRAVLAERERVLGPDHLHTLFSRNNLAKAVEALGRYQEAADLHRAVLAEREHVLGPDHPNTLDSRDNLASALNNLGRHSEAADLHRAVLADSERVLGPDHPDTLASRNNLALALDRLGRHQEAADLHRAVLADRECVLGPDHPSTLTSRNNLAEAEAREAARQRRRRRWWRRNR